METKKTKLSRRAILAAGGALGLASAGPAFGQRARRGVPARGEFVVRNAFVMSMDDQLKDIPVGDVHVRNGEIVDVGRKLKGGGVEIDGSRLVAMPGFVDTHQHMAGALFRGLNGDTSDNNYFAVTAKVGSFSTPEDIYQGVRLACVEALNAGITTCNDLSHAIFSPAHAEASLRAHRDTGLRSRMSVTLADSGKDCLTWDQIADFKKKVDADNDGGLHHVGVYLANPPADPAKAAAYAADFSKARQLGIPVSIDAVNSEAVQRLAAAKLLGPDLLAIHCINFTKADRQLLIVSKTPYCCAPLTELTSIGTPQIGEMWADGVLCSFSVDAPASQDSNFFNVLRGGLGIVREVTIKSDKFTFREALEIGTMGGAKALGIADRVGSLTPGKRADLILVKKHGFSTAIGSNFWVHRLLHTAQSEDVDTVVVDGRILKRAGRLATDADAVLREAGAAVDAMVARSGFQHPPMV